MTKGRISEHRIDVLLDDSKVAYIHFSIFNGLAWMEAAIEPYGVQIDTMAMVMLFL